MHRLAGGNMGAKEKKKSGLNSIGVKVGLLISAIMIVILGLKAVYEIRDGYGEAEIIGENYKLEEVRRLAASLETKIAEVHDAGLYTQTYAQSLLKKAKEERSREDVIHFLTDVYNSSTPMVIGIGVCFEANEFDGKDAENISEASPLGKLTPMSAEQKEVLRLIIPILRRENGLRRHWKIKRSLCMSRILMRNQS